MAALGGRSEEEPLERREDPTVAAQEHGDQGAHGGRGG